MTPKATSAAVLPGLTAGKVVRTLPVREKARLLEPPTTSPAVLMPLALASGSPPMLSVVNPPAALRTKLVNKFGVAALSELKPTTDPLLLIPLTVVPPAALPGPSNDVNA